MFHVSWNYKGTHMVKWGKGSIETICCSLHYTSITSQFPCWQIIIFIVRSEWQFLFFQSTTLIWNLEVVQWL